jgi:hypothetical protein
MTIRTTIICKKCQKKVTIEHEDDEFPTTCRPGDGPCSSDEALEAQSQSDLWDITVIKAEPEQDYF